MFFRKDVHVFWEKDTLPADQRRTSFEKVKLFHVKHTKEGI